MNLLTLFSHFKLNLKNYLYLKFKIFDKLKTPFLSNSEGVHLKGLVETQTYHFAYI